MFTHMAHCDGMSFATHESAIVQICVIQTRTKRGRKTKENSRVQSSGMSVPLAVWEWCLKLARIIV